MAKDKEKMTVVRKVANAALMSNGLIRVSNVRLSYPHLDAPYKKEGDKGAKKYGVVGLLPKDTHKAAKKLIDEVIADVMKENKVKALAADKKFLRDGDESDKAEHEGHWTISAREERRPVLKEMVDGELTLVEPEDAKETFYGGCWGSLLIRPWFQNNDYGKRVNAGLTAVTKKGDDESFGEGRISEDEVDEAFDDDEEFEGPRRSGGGSKKKSQYEADDDDDPDDL
jgi:ssDNA-binding protein